MRVMGGRASDPVGAAPAEAAILAGMIVSRAELEEEIAQAAAEAGSEEHGLFGPESITWRLARDSIVFLGAGRAALLQLAHPYVAHAIEQHSATTRDPLGRFNRTFLHVFGMVFGDRETAVGAARRVRRIHDRVSGAIGEDSGRFPRGHRYDANEAGALAWVFATLIETTVMAFEAGFGPLSAADREGYYQEARRFARLFGLGDGMVPGSYGEFTAYCARTMAGDELAVGKPAREIAGFLLSAKGAPLSPAMGWYRTMTAGMLPERLREGYGLRFSRGDQAVYRASLRALRLGWPRVPERLRLRPEYVEAVRRLEGRPRPDRLGRGLQDLLLRGVRPR
jgi:uncharacterized protein (DUF2236 family)